MGHRAGWLALEAGIAGGADVILIPEIPYDIGQVAEAIRERTRKGKHFSILVVAEGAMSRGDAARVEKLAEDKRAAKTDAEKRNISSKLQKFHNDHVGHTIKLTKQLEELTRQESRVTILGHLQRGGAPSATDRVLATRLGTYCAEVLNNQQYGVMLAIQGEKINSVALEDVVREKKFVPVNHPLIAAARLVGTRFGD
jgi:6-phosphofructokinase 1